MSHSRPHTTDVEQQHNRKRQEQTFGDVMHSVPTMLIKDLIHNMQEQEKRMTEIMNLAHTTKADNITMRAENAEVRARLAALQEPQYAPGGPDHNQQHVALPPVSNYHA